MEGSFQAPKVPKGCGEMGALAMLDGVQGTHMAGTPLRSCQPGTLLPWLPGCICFLDRRGKGSVFIPGTSLRFYAQLSPRELHPTGSASDTPGRLWGSPRGPAGVLCSVCIRSFPAEVIRSPNPPKSLHYFFVNRAFPSQNNQHFSVAPTSGFDWPQPCGVDAGALTLWRGERGEPAFLPA